MKVYNSGNSGKYYCCKHQKGYLWFNLIATLNISCAIIHEHKFSMRYRQLRLILKMLKHSLSEFWKQLFNIMEKYGKVTLFLKSNLNHLKTLRKLQFIFEFCMPKKRKISFSFKRVLRVFSYKYAFNLKS